MPLHPLENSLFPVLMHLSREATVQRLLEKPHNRLFEFGSDIARYDHPV